MVTINDLKNYFSSYCGLVGEENLAIALSIAIFGADQNCLIYGPSSGGKTKMAESVLSLTTLRDVDPDDLMNDSEKLLNECGVYRYEFGSNTAIAYSEAELERARLLFIPELQKVAKTDLVIEVLKTFGEGRDALRDVVQGGSGTKKKQKMSQTTILSTIATENEFKIEEEAELQNRLLTMHIDDSSDQTREIMVAKAHKYFPIADGNIDPQLVLDIKRHVNEMWDNNNCQVFNPFGVTLSASEGYMPAKYVLSRRFIDYYLAVMAGVTRWYGIQGEREYIENLGYVTNLEDVYLTEKLIGAAIRASMLKLPPQAQHIFKVFQAVDEAKTDELASIRELYYDGSHDRAMLPSTVLMQQLGEMGITMSLPLVEDILDSLSQYGYLLKDPGRNSKYGLVSAADPNSSVVNYRELLQDTINLMEHEYGPDSDIYQRWLGEQSLKIQDPLTLDGVDLTSTSEVNQVNKTERVIEKQSTGLERFLR